VENTTYRLALEILKLKAQVTNGSVIKLTSIVVNGLSIRNKNKIIYKNRIWLCALVLLVSRSKCTYLFNFL